MSEALRIVAGGLVALVCAYIGLLIKRRYKSREKFYEQAKDYFAFFEKELTFKKTPLPEINRQFANQNQGEFATMILQGTNVDTKKDRSLAFLKMEEREQAYESMRGLGKSGYQEQLAYVKRWQAEFQDKASKCSQENKKYGGMYFKLCVLVGIALLILIA